MTTQPLRKILLSSSLIMMMAVSSAYALEATSDKAKRTYVDPVTGETKQAVKLLSEMTDTEKALLSNEEYRALKELEAKLKTAEEQKGNGE